MQEVKNNLKKMGDKMRESNENHKGSLRQKLIALSPEEPAMLPKHFVWFPVLSWGAIAVVAFVVGNAMYDRPISFYEYERSITKYGLGDSPMVSVFYDDSDVNNIAARDSYGDDALVRESETTKGQEIVDYEEDNGAMLEQSVSMSILTQEDDVSETIAALFASLGGHLSSIRSNDDEYATITGSIPVSRISFFYEQLDTFVKNDAFIEKTLSGDSVTSEAIDLAKREQALRDAEAEITEQLKNAKTDEQKKMLQESLETISDEMIQLTDEQDALNDRVDYVTVSVSIEKLPSMWGIQSEYQLNDVIAGYESPTLWQGIIINVLTVFFIAIEFLSVTFWILIPLGIFVLMRLKRRRILNELE